jgi:acetyl-CoA C-acetyltransferase
MLCPPLKGKIVKDVFIVGIGQVPVSTDRTTHSRDLGAEAVCRALANAGLAPERTDALYIGNMASGMLERQQQLGGLIAERAGLEGVEAFTVEAACASGAAAARMGYLTVAGGAHEVVVVCGVEQMTQVDRETVTNALATAADWELEGARGENFLSLNARLMRLYAQTYDTHADAFAPFAITAHENALTNPNALFHKEIGLENYRDSRFVVEPLRLFDVSPICNGSAAIVLANADVARALRAGRPAVRVRASAAATTALALAQRSDPLKLEAVTTSTEKSLALAGLRREDISFFELHDAYTIMTALTLESAGFAAPGTATELAAEGRFAAGGALPIATLGGLKARGHPVGATGVYQLAEAYLQLAGLAGPNQLASAEHALVQNIGGTGATVVTHVLSRDG